MARKNNGKNEEETAGFFHRVESLLPASQSIEAAGPDDLAVDVLARMLELDFSQVPVLNNGSVAGLFSHRSFALKTPNRLTKGRNRRLEEIPVVELMVHNPDMLHPEGDVEDAFELLDRQGAALVGTREDLRGVITPIDVLEWLDEISKPFVRIGEVERSLREIVRNRLSADEIAECAKSSLKKKYSAKPAAIPLAVEKMTLDELRLLVVRTENWKRIVPALGPSLPSAKSYLDELPEIRNHVFHFRGTLNVHQRNALEDARDWLQGHSASLDFAKQMAIGGMHSPGHEVQSLAPSESREPPAAPTSTSKARSSTSPTSRAKPESQRSPGRKIRGAATSSSRKSTESAPPASMKAPIVASRVSEAGDEVNVDQTISTRPTPRKKISFVEIGPFRLNDEPLLRERFEAATPTGERSVKGERSLFGIDGPDRFELTLALEVFDNDERQVRVAYTHGSGEKFERLTTSCRLVVSKTGDLLRVALNQARIKPDGRSSIFRASLRELDEVTEANTEVLLTGLGADRVGTRARLLEDTSSHRRSLCALFPETALLVPVAAYVVTRVAPIYKEIPSENRD